MIVPLKYVWRSLWTRRLTTVLTLGGIALVAFVFAAVLMLAHGLEETLIETGSENNVIALRRSATSELVSQIERDGANVLLSQPEIAIGQGGKSFASTETYVIINLGKKETNDMGNIVVRGISPQAIDLRPQLKITNGRMFEFGKDEIIVGKGINAKFAGADIGQRIKFGDDWWTVVGVFEAAGTAFESEIWGDVEQFMPAFGRPVFSTVTARLKEKEGFAALKTRMENDPRTQYIDLKIERAYYQEQSKLMSDFIKILGLIVTIIFSIGAVIGAAITMYAAVANRTREIGTFRALGFSRPSVYLAFLVEAIFISIIGGSVGIALASLMSFFSFSTTNFSSFSELAFGFRMSPDIVLGTLVFSLVMGVCGGFFPAVRATRLKIIDSLRAAS